MPSKQHMILRIAMLVCCLSLPLTMDAILALDARSTDAEQPMAIDSAARRIPLTINFPPDVEWPKDWLIYFDISDKDKKFVCESDDIDPKHAPMLTLPKGLNDGFIAWRLLPARDDSLTRFIYLKEPVPFTADTKSLTLNLSYQKPVKFVIELKVPQGNPPLRNFRIFDVTDQGPQRVYFDGIHLPMLRDIVPNDKRQIIFYGAPNRIFSITAVYGDFNPDHVNVISPDFKANDTQDEFRGKWEIAKRQLICVKFVIADGNKRNLAKDIYRITVNTAQMNTKDGMIYLNPAEDLVDPKRHGGAIKFSLNDATRQLGYTKIISGATLSPTPQTKEHTVVLTKERVEGELTFVATDAATGEKLTARVYHARATDANPKPTIAAATVSLAPGKYRAAVTAPGYDFLPLTLEVKKNEKRNIACKLHKSRTVALTVNCPGETGPGGQLPGIYLVHSPAAAQLSRPREQPLMPTFTVPFDPRLGNSLIFVATGMALQAIPLDAKTPERLTVNLTPGVKVTGKFSPEFADHVKAKANNFFAAAVPQVSRPHLEQLDSAPMTLLLFPQDNPYIPVGGAKAQPGEPWEAHVMPGTYRVAMEVGDVLFRLSDTVTIPEQGETAFPGHVLTDKVHFEVVSGDARTCANDLFRRLPTK